MATSFDIPMRNWNKYAMDNYGYECKTSFGNDFDIADSFGLDAIKDTYNRCFREWKNNCEYITELCMILNWKCWMWCGHLEGHPTNEEFAKLYDNLYYKLRDWCLDHLKGDDLQYFLRTTD